MPKNPVTDPITVEHRTAVNENPPDDEAEALRTLNRSRDQIRDQILDRLWQLANLNPEQTRCSIAGQIKAMSMIVAIEGLIPNHLKGRSVPSAQAQPAAPAVKAQIYISEAQRRRQHQTEVERPAGVETAVPEQPVTSEEPDRAAAPAPGADPLPPNLDYTSPLNPFVHPERATWVPDTMDATYDTNLNPVGPFRLPIPPRKAALPRGR